MKKTMDETAYRREKQTEYNTKHGITPKGLNKALSSILGKDDSLAWEDEIKAKAAAEPDLEYLTKAQIEKLIREKRKAMETAAKELNFMDAAKYRDEIKLLQEKL
jgi:excinuclease ABC subunit B